MVTTRKSTGSLPAPKRKNVADTVSSDDDEFSFEAASEEDTVEQPVKKGAKKEHITTSRGQSGSPEARLGLCDDGGEEAGAIVSEKPENRMNSLITGEKSKGAQAKSGDASKKPKRRAQLRKSDLGKLARMMDLSVEVFSEIACHLAPVDLLQLSRAARTLRNFLLSRSSRPIWVACLEATGIPPCPPDMSEPQYVNLYFETECHACGHPRVERYTAHLRIRLCRGCSKLNVIQGKELVKKHFKEDVSRMFEIYSLVPWNSLDVHDENSFGTRNSKNQNRYFLKYDFVEVVKAYLETNPNSEERKSFVEKRHELIRNIARSERDVDSWRSRKDHERFEVDEKLCKERERQIKEKLHGLGYSHEELDSMCRGDHIQTRVKWTQIICQPRELTDRSWKGIRPKLEELIRHKQEFVKMQAIEQNRRKRRSELAFLYREWAVRNQLDKADVAPLSLIDLCMLPVVKELIEGDDCRTEITQERWRPIEEKLPEFWTEHAEKVERDCLDVLITRASTLGDMELLLSDSETGIEDGVNDPSILWRAYVFFSKWPGFQVAATYADCLSSLRDIQFSETEMGWASRDKGKLFVSTTAVRVANAFLSSLSLPKETTMQQVQDMGRVFICQQCDPILQKLMTWKELVLHVSQDINDYSRVQKLSLSWPNGPMLLETHKVVPDKAGTPLLRVDADFVRPPATYINEAVDGIIPEESCSPCRTLGIYKWFLYNEDWAAHMRTYHIINVEPLWQ